MGPCAIDQQCDAWRGFVAWAATGLRHEAKRLAERKRLRTLRELLVLDVPVLDETNGGGIGSARDEVARSDDTEEEALDHLVLDEVLRTLTPAQQQIIRSVIIMDLPEHSVAGALGISQQSVNRMKWAALRKIKRYFANWGDTGGERLRNPATID